MMTGESPQDATANYAGDRASPATNPTAPMRGVSDGKTATAMSLHKGISGTIFEAAFVDPAYTWPPAEGQGKNAIELQASTALIKSVAPHDQIDDLDDDEVSLTPSMMSSDDEGGAPRRGRRNNVQSTTTTTTKKGPFGCCKSTDEQIVTSNSSDLVQSFSNSSSRSKKGTKTERRAERQRRIIAKKKKRRRETRARERYRRVPEGILIYRLDTSDRTITLVSGPSSNTDLSSLMKYMVVINARPSSDVSRRGIVLTGAKGEMYTLVACEQRTAIAWLESMDMMLASKPNDATKAAMENQGVETKRVLSTQTATSNWAKGKESKLSQTERDQIEERYVNLAAYSNNLIRAGAFPSANSQTKGGKGGGKKVASSDGGADNIF